jgi:23S rRNA pseudouridine2605 synthase
MNEQREERTEVRPGQRISKAMARAGLCSRRDAEAWIEAGRVSVNGRVLTRPAFNVGPEDEVRVDGERLPAPERTRLFFFHKPRGLVTTARDPEGRATIFEALPKDLPRVVAVGRLDINSEGLLLLTNDGGLARVLELPATGWLRRYRVRAHGEVSQARLDGLREGVSIEGVHYAGIDARLERQQGSNVWLMIGLREGKNREIKRVLEYLGLLVNRLIRISFGPFELGDLPEGAVEELNARVLRDQLGLKLAKEAGANFDAPVGTHRVEAPPRRHEGSRLDRADRSRPPMRGRAARPEIARELAARGERPETKTPRKRKHVSALRAATRAHDAGPRKRMERSATSDRKGRKIKVERIMTAPRTTPAPANDHDRGQGRDGRKRAPAAAELGEKGRFKRSAPKHEHTNRLDSALARDDRPIRQGPRHTRGDGKTQPERLRLDRGFEGKHNAGPSREGRPSRFGKGQNRGESQGKPEGRRPPPRT